ncbi:MAG: hypothetical protein HKN67_10555, partial [Saprospiraceae bacterium]|nr:hypothetical protein [Saprospiraceae bacterium]
MQYFITGLIFSFILLIPSSGYAQSRILENTKVEVTYARKQGRTMAITELVAREQTNRAKKKAAKRDRLIPRNFVGRYKNRTVEKGKIHDGEDKLWQKSIPKSQLNGIIPKVNIDGLFSGGSPHDPTGDVGKNYYMQSVNVTSIGIYTKEGELVMDFTGNTLWNTLGFNSGGDPIIIYDQEAERWLITEFPSGFGGSANQLLVAVSVTGNPMGEYDVYNFNTTRFPDYPKYGVWTDAYSVTTNEEGAGTLHGYFINKSQLLGGEEIVEIQRVAVPGNSNTEAGFFVATPVDWTGLTPPPAGRDPLIVSLNDASWNVGQQEDQVEFFSIDIDWENPGLTQVSQLSIEVSPYDSNPCSETGFYFECLPQKGGGAIDGIPETIMNQVHYRNFNTYESIVMNFITDVTDGDNLSGIRWIEFRRTDSEEWSVYQEGTFAPHDGLHRMMGSICMDKNGNIGLAYNVTSDTTYIGIRATGRRASDPLGIMTIDEIIVAEGENPIISGTRFGDYAHMSIDPVDDRTFWYTTEYAKGGTSYTRILAYELSK